MFHLMDRDGDHMISFNDMVWSLNDMVKGDQDMVKVKWAYNTYDLFDNGILDEITLRWCFKYAFGNKIKQLDAL